MMILGMSPTRILVSGAGAAGGIYVSQRWVTPFLEDHVPSIFHPSGNELGLDDLVDGVCAVIGAAAANKAFSDIKS
jgi:hypothetical protein